MKYRQTQNLNITSQKVIDFFCKVPVSDKQTKNSVQQKTVQKYIVFSTRKRLTNTFLNVDNERIAESNSVKYLA